MCDAAIIGWADVPQMQRFLLQRFACLCHTQKGQYAT
jgi:hypothetical protein